MFKKTLNLSELKRDINEEFGNLSGDEALQVVHRGKQIKVIITQERYFKLLGQLAQLTATEPADLVESVASATQKQRLKKKLEKAADEGDRKTDRALDQGRLGSA